MHPDTRRQADTRAAPMNKYTDAHTYLCTPVKAGRDYTRSLTRALLVFIRLCCVRSVYRVCGVCHVLPSPTGPCCATRAMPHHAVPCWAVLCRATPCCAMPHVPHCTVQRQKNV